MECPHCHAEIEPAIQVTLKPVGPTPDFVNVSWERRVQRRLTPTEMRTVALAIEGLTYKEIAHRLHLHNRQTVNMRMCRVFEKLGIRTRGELMRFCFGGY